LAQRLADTLRQRLGLRVVLTRSGDYALSPYERTAVANHQRADLFLSLHLNADFSAQQRGMEIYVLESPGGGNIAEATSPLTRATLWDQAQLDSLEQSHRLAQVIYQQAVDSPYIKNSGIYSTSVLVLEGAGMPALLIELAYLSHQEEEEQLWAEEYKGALVEILYQGILSYKRTGQGSVTPGPD
jgi:N-acetylmuramoyl-L-alanine amidase